MSEIKTHPSVRIKGTENNYNPAPCFDHLCSTKSAHMHCPFCVKTDIYQDPVILKAHYRVKHVDKGIDFAGLKILRCCDHCDIVGIIKGEKKFKGAHWHCYKCRNGFNRRDEAIKHYKTHFRNPQTTFQIQIAQEVNGSNQIYGDGNTATIDQTGISIHPALTEAVMSTSLAEDAGIIGQTNQVTMANGKVQDGTVHVSVAANETVDTSDGQTHHIMIIQEEAIGSSGPYTTQIISSEDVRMAEEKEQSNEQNSQNKYEELQQKYHQLEEEKINMEKLFKTEIEQLKMQIQTLNSDINLYQKREQELLEQVSVPLDRNIEALLKHLETQHRDLLHQQLLVIKREYKPNSYLSSTHPLSSNKTDTSANTGNKDTDFIIECNVDSEENVDSDTGKTVYEKGEIVVREEVEEGGEDMQQQVADVASVDNEEDVDIGKKIQRLVAGERTDNSETVTQTQELNMQQMNTEQYTYCVTEAGDTGLDGKNAQQNNPLVVCIEYPTSDIEKTLVENVFTIQESHSQVTVGHPSDEPASKRQKQSL